jgi:hypothetical protein
MMKFKVTWKRGYGDSDGKSEIVNFDELLDWNLDAYLGDEWIDEFKEMTVGGDIKYVYGPCGEEEVHYERIA